MRRSRQSRTRGYTVMEVMAALAVFTVSAFGIVSLQKVALIGNRNAKTLATANAIGQTWIERLRYDAAHWTSTTTLGNTTYLNLVETGWFVPTQGIPAKLGAPRADVFGVDVYPNDANPVGYCTHVRLTWMGDPATASLIRAEIRVFWARDGGTVNDNDCTNPGNIVVPSPIYGIAVFTTGIERQDSGS